VPDRSFSISSITDTGYVILVVYVDDIVITGDDADGIAQLKQFLQKRFQTKNLGKLRYFLGLEVATSQADINLSQRKYVLDLLDETGFLGTHPVDTPMDPNVKLLKNGGVLFGKLGKYRRLVGKLNYLTITRPDISNAVSIISQFLDAPRVPHWETVICIIWYLKKAPGLGLLYKPNGHIRIEGFVDADWAESRIDRRSTTGFCTFLGGNLVS
ncbi:uncharacterized protein LOC111382708, partial [Olea europaea var. sylvestris]|uniref:uncharacterized protein LOC111382708 n=1 Tax=Olea europaea var. sylvestris TaxID=158386 RepID=UPI000C1D39FC